MSMTGMLQRCWDHDYRAPSFYMITVITEPRRECLSSLNLGAEESTDSETKASSPVSAAAHAAGPSLSLSPIGKVVCEVWRRTSTVYSGVEACEYVAMPDHFHGILRVKEWLKRPMGHIVKAFKRVSEQECRSKGLLLQPNDGLVSAAAPAADHVTLWQEGFQDSILLRRGQLEAMVNYIADNPRRLAAKRANPELFTAVSNAPLGPDRPCTTIGNRHLLDHPLKYQIQISRNISRADIEEQKEKLLYAAEHGAVLVSPCISAGEKEIARAAMNAGKPLIVLVANGFAPNYKPPGRYFDACAAGRLLMVAPFPCHSQKSTITRQQCLTLNEWARFIVERHPR